MIRPCHPTRASRVTLLAAILFALGAESGTSRAAFAQGAGEPAATEVRIERIRPKREKHATLRFLKANRDFIRGRFDLLREKPAGGSAAAEAVDPRFLSYQAMLASVRGAGDSLALADEARARREQFQSVTELGLLEADLDRMERLLASQRDRLAALQADFTGRQRTALEVVVSGDPGIAEVSSVALTLEGGATLTLPLTAEQRASLRRGGMLELFHGMVEPRQQVIEVALAGGGWDAGGPGFVTIEPARDRLTLLRLDLSPARPDRGAASMLATTWQLDTGIHAHDRSEPTP